MSSVLIRGLPPSVRRKVRKLAGYENLSVNRVLIQLIQEAVEVKMKQKEKEAEEKDVFQRIKEFREEIYRKHGKLEDSLKLLHEAREERMRRYDEWIK